LLAFFLTENHIVPLSPLLEAGCGAWAVAWSGAGAEGRGKTQMSRQTNERANATKRTGPDRNGAPRSGRWATQEYWEIQLELRRWFGAGQQSSVRRP